MKHLEYEPREFSEHEDGFKVENELVCQVNEHGTPSSKINTEALYNDRQAFWQYHEKKIIIILVVCVLYFLGVLI